MEYNLQKRKTYHFSVHLKLTHCKLTILQFKKILGTFLVVQWLRLHVPIVVGQGSILGQGTRSHMHATTKSPHAATRSPHAATKDPACCNKDPARSSEDPTCRN